MATRKQLQKRVENHIKDLAKRGIDPSVVTQGRSVQSLAWSQKSYDNFMENKRIAIRKEKKKQRLQKVIVTTNTQGYDVNRYDYNRITELQKKYNKKLEKEYKKYLAKYGKPDKITESFLKGKSVRHKNSGENILLPENFGGVNLINRLNENIDIDEFIRLTEKKIAGLRYENLIDDNSDFFDKEFLKPLVDTLSMHEKERGILLDLYKKMNIVERYQFNKDMKRVMDIVESDTKNPRSMYTPYYLIREFMEKNYSREFLQSY